MTVLEVSDSLVFRATAGKPAPVDLTLGLPPLQPGALVHSVGHLTWAKEIGKASYILREMLPGHGGVEMAEPVKVLQATQKKKRSSGSLRRRTKVCSWKVRVFEHSEMKMRSSYEPTVVRSVAAEEAQFHMLSGPVAEQQHTQAGSPSNLIIRGGIGGDGHALELGVVEENSVFELCVTQLFTPFQAIGLAVACIHAAAK